MNAVQSYVQQAQKFKILDRAEELRISNIHRDPTASPMARRRAGELLVNSNLRFALKQAHEFSRRYGQPLEDMIQSANEGLLNALRIYDPARGYRFISFAVHWVRAKLTMACLYNYSLVKVGTTGAQRILFSKARYLYNDIKTKYPDMSEEDIFKRLGEITKTKPEVARDIHRRITNNDLSLQTPVRNHHGTENLTFQDLLEEPDESAETKLDKAQQHERLREVAYGVARNARERFVIKFRLLSDEPMTLNDIGKNFRNKSGGAISRERMRQVEESIIKRIRAAM